MSRVTSWLRSRCGIAVLLAVAVAVLGLVLAPEVLAATGNDIGRNVGDLLRRYAGEIYGGIVAIVALIFLINRRYSELAVFLFAAVVVAWMVFSPDALARAARSIGRQVFGS